MVLTSSRVANPIPECTAIPADSTGGCSLSVVMTGVDGSRPVEVCIVAQRLCFEERARIEAACAAGFNATEIAEALGRRPTPVQRELARGGGLCGYEEKAA